MSENDRQAWVASWLDAVGEARMTQRRLTSVERHADLAMLVNAARARGIHLLVSTDDRGQRLVAASRHPFEVLC